MKPQTEIVKGFTTGKPTPKQAKAWRELVRRLTAEPKGNDDAGSAPVTK